MSEHRSGAPPAGQNTPEEHSAAQPAEQPFQLVAVPSTEKYDPEDDRWRQQVTGFYGDLEREVGPVERVRTPVEGTKGGAETVILALGSAGAFTAAVQFFRAWLGRDRSRSLEISWSDGKDTRTVAVKGDAIDDSALEEIAKAAAKRIGGPGWATPATEPS